MIVRRVYPYFFPVFLMFLSCNIKEAAGQKSFSYSKEQTFILPRKYKPLEFKKALTVMFTRLPVDWVETSLDIPVFQFGTKLGLPAGFTIDANIQSVFVANQLRVGPHWNIEIGRFSAAVGVDAAFMYGKMTISDFNNEASGWFAYPSLFIGFKGNHHAFSMGIETNRLLSFKLTSGSAEISRGKNAAAGRAISFYLEQPLWKKHTMVLGLVNNFQKLYYLAWPAFSTFNRVYYIPQFYIGLVL